MKNNDIGGLYDFVEQVLINRFPSEPHKQKPKRTSKGLRFHCPFCGDSYNPRANPRGNLYFKKKRYVCFNGGCYASMTLEKFVAYFSQEYNISIDNIDLTDIESGDVDMTVYSSMVLTKDNNIYDYVEDMGLLEYMPKMSDIINLLGLVDVNMLPEHSKVRVWLNNRSAYCIPDLSKRVFASRADDRVFIMNVDDLSGRVLSYASREIGKKMYIIQIYSDMLKFWTPPCEVIQESVEFLDNLSSYFNILNVDFTKPINIAEGQFDAMFLTNYLAISGVSKIDFILYHIKSDNINEFMDRDDAGYKAAFKMLNGYGIFLWSKIIDNMKRAFPESIIDINKIHDINELFTFLYKRSWCTFTHAKFNELIFKYVSTSIYDHLLM